MNQKVKLEQYKFIMECDLGMSDQKSPRVSAAHWKCAPDHRTTCLQGEADSSGEWRACSPGEKHETETSRPTFPFQSRSTPKVPITKADLGAMSASMNSKQTLK